MIIRSDQEKLVKKWGIFGNYVLLSNYLNPPSWKYKQRIWHPIRFFLFRGLLTARCKDKPSRPSNDQTWSLHCWLQRCQLSRQEQHPVMVSPLTDGPPSPRLQWPQFRARSSWTGRPDGVNYRSCAGSMLPLNALKLSIPDFVENTGWRFTTLLQSHDRDARPILLWSCLVSFLTPAQWRLLYKK